MSQLDRVRPLGFEPRTCGLRERLRGCRHAGMKGIGPGQTGCTGQARAAVGGLTGLSGAGNGACPATVVVASATTPDRCRALEAPRTLAGIQARRTCDRLAEGHTASAGGPCQALTAGSTVREARRAPSPEFQGPPRRGGPGQGHHADRGQGEDAALRANRALELRTAGATYDQIAQALGYSDRSSACRAVQRCLDRDYERTRGLQRRVPALHLGRIERAIRASGRGRAGAPRGHRPARPVAGAAGKLLGSDAPIEVAVSQVTRDTAHRLLDDLEVRFNSLWPNGTSGVVWLGPEGNGR